MYFYLEFSLRISLFVSSNNLKFKTPQVDQEKMEQLFAPSDSYGSEDRHEGSDHGYPQRAIEPVNVGPTAASGHHSPAVNSQPATAPSPRDTIIHRNNVD